MFITVGIPKGHQTSYVTFQPGVENTHPDMVRLAATLSSLPRPYLDQVTIILLGHIRDDLLTEANKKAATRVIELLGGG